MTIVENLPQEVRDKGLFCVWKREERDGKPTKAPYNPRTGGGARSSDPATFTPLPIALEALDRGNYAGLGVGIFGDLSAVDLDHCIDEHGVIADWALDIMSTMSSYTEYSPSRRGGRSLFKASSFTYDKEKYYINNQKRGLEVYVSGCTHKFVTVTGNVISDCGYHERGAELQRVLDKYMVRPVRSTPSSILPGPVSIEDTELIEKARNGRRGAAFSALWAGDTTGYASRSEADIALCNALAWWANRDPERVDRLFR